MTNINSVTDPEARRFLHSFLLNRKINEEIYKRIPEDKLDFRMVDNPTRKSDSPRESLIHQISVTRNYILGITSGKLRFGQKYSQAFSQPEKMSKQELLAVLTLTIEELIQTLSDPNISQKKVRVPWSKIPIPAIQTLWSLNNHEILHTGWNLALMDHLQIERFPLLRQIWG